MTRDNDTRSEQEMWGAAGGALILLSLVLFIFALVGTVLCMNAWNDRREYFGRELQPEDARKYVQGGAVGAGVGIHIFVLLAITFHFLNGSLVLFVFGGYTVGFFGSILSDEAQKEKATQAPQDRIAQFNRNTVTPEPRRIDQPQEAARSFVFADWDDEGPRA